MIFLELIQQSSISTAFPPSLTMMSPAFVSAAANSVFRRFRVSHALRPFSCSSQRRNTLAVHPSAQLTDSSTASELRPLRKGDTIDVTVTHIGYGGVSVGRIASIDHIHPDDRNISIYAPKGACPGDLVRCSITKVRRRRNRPNHRPLTPPPDIGPNDPPPASYVEAVFNELISPSDQALQSPCPHFGHFRLNGGGCGGCSSLQIPYASQLAEKANQMSIIFSSSAADHQVSISPIIPCASTLHYRNKMEFTFGRRWYQSTDRSRDQTDDFNYALGLHAPQRFDKIVEITQCQIQPDVGNAILELIRTRSPAMLLEPFDPRLNQGYMRNVAIRTAMNSENECETMVNLITSPCEVPERLVPLAQEIIERFPEVVCVLQNIRGVTGSHNTEDHLERLLVGKRAYIEQTLCGLTFRISANSFFQTNSEQAAVLYDEVRRAAKLSREDIVLDLFCGTGTIALCLAGHVKHVYGIDLVASAIEDARVNAASNGIENASFEQGNLDKLKEGTGDRTGFSNPDVIVVDPPRAGLHPDLIRYLGRTEARRVVYVSCNPMTQIQDVSKLMELAPDRFRVSCIQPIDMFPNTHHVECIVVLERNIE